MRIFITGSASHLARACLPKLCRDERIHHIVGIDLAPAILSHAKFRHHVLDIRSEQVGALLAGCDALVHLAWVVLRGKMLARTMYAINVEGTQTLFGAARTAGVARLIHLSSAAVYGAGERLNETTTFMPYPDFLYARHKVEIEHFLATEFPQALRLRPHIILGPHCQPLLKQLLKQPCYPRLPSPAPRLQCVHEEDVAQAILLAIFSDSDGALNLATADSFSLKETVRARHRHTLALPLSLLHPAFKLAWRTTGWGGEPAWLQGLSASLTLDCARAQQVLDWQPQYDAAATLASVSSSRFAL